MTNPRTKGSNFEKSVARYFSEWWYNKSFEGVRADELPIRRSPRSGGFDKRIAPADLFCVEDSKNFPFLVECKKQEALTWWSLYKDITKTKIYIWWEKLLDESKNVGKLPLLVFSKNHCPVMLVCRGADILNVNSEPHFSFWDKEGELVIIVPLLSFFENCEPADFLPTPVV